MTLLLARLLRRFSSFINGDDEGGWEDTSGASSSVGKSQPWPTDTSEYQSFDQITAGGVDQFRDERLAGAFSWRTWSCQYG